MPLEFEEADGGEGGIDSTAVIARAEAASGGRAVCAWPAAGYTNSAKTAVTAIRQSRIITLSAPLDFSYDAVTVKGTFLVTDLPEALSVTVISRR